jgi:beta-galactosidase
MLSKEPFIKILGAEKIIAVPDSAGIAKLWPVQVAGNASQMELTINGATIGMQKTNNGIAEWNVALKEGENKLSVSCIINGKTYTDQQTVSLHWLTSDFAVKKEAMQPLNILVGAKRYFTDSENRTWIPAVTYGSNGWGFIGGKLFKAPGNGRLPYGTDKNIKGTDDDPIYQTQQIGIEQFRFDVPPGEYELVLHFAELLGGPVKDIPYNLSNDDRIEPNGKRIFSVYVNGELLLDNFNIAEQVGTATPVVKKLNVKQPAGKPILVDFKAIEGEPVLNAIQLRRLEAGKQEQVNNYK